VRTATTALERAGVTGHAHPGVSVVDDVRAIRTGQGRPYTVFTPFYRNWERVTRRAEHDPPPPGILPAEIAELDDADPSGFRLIERYPPE